MMGEFLHYFQDLSRDAKLNSFGLVSLNIQGKSLIVMLTTFRKGEIFVGNHR